jgi:hypothetical protein
VELCGIWDVQPRSSLDQATQVSEYIHLWATALVKQQQQQQQLESGTCFADFFPTLSKLIYGSEFACVT